MFKTEDGKLNKDFIFKILFSLEVCLLPMIISAKILMPDWTMAIFVGVIILVRLVMIFFKMPANYKHIILDGVGNVIVLTFALITYCCYAYISVPLTVLTCVFFALEEIIKVYFYYKPNSQLVEALIFSVEMFNFVVLASLTLVEFTTTTLTVGAIALTIATVALCIIQGYNFFYFYVFKKDKKR